MQVVLVANSLPALNDITAMEIPAIVAEAAKVCLYASMFAHFCSALVYKCVGK